MKKLTTTFATLFACALLTSCSMATDAEAAACEKQGGRILSEAWDTTVNGGQAGSGRLEFCSVDGVITEVYNEEIVEVSGGFLGNAHRNSKAFQACEKLDGKTYETTRVIGKVTYTRFLCVQDGRVITELNS